MERDTYRALIAPRLTALRQQIAACAPARVIHICAVSKGQPVAAIEAALNLGIALFGENRVQEAQAKYAEIRERHPQLKLHLIGPLQSNKAAEAVALFDCIETVDRPKIVDALAAEMKRQARTLPVFIQVNTGEEPQKAGVLPQDADALIAYAQSAGLQVEGLMCVPPADAHPAPHFAFLRQMAQRHGFKTLSMGMSGDYMEAVRMGATQVRLGTALFGSRG